MLEASWLEVSLLADGELAEAVAEVFSRFAPSGVAIESGPPLDEQLKSNGPHPALVRVSAYLPVDGSLEDKKNRLQESLWYLGRIQPLSEPQYKIVHQADWAEAWKQHYLPIPIGSRLIVVPAWLQLPPESDRVPIYMDPGMAFGTGTHPSTQLCLEILEDLLRERKPLQPRKSCSGESGADVIDVGCGSGILSVAALKLGAARALGVDTDPIAVEAAGENACLNGVSDRMETGLGSLEEVKAGNFSIRSAELVLANIVAPVLVRLLDEGLGTLPKKGGRLVLSGIVVDQAEGVVQALERSGMHVIEQRQMGDWITLLASPEGETQHIIEAKGTPAT